METAQNRSSEVSSHQLLSKSQIQNWRLRHTPCCFDGPLFDARVPDSNSEPGSNTSPIQILPGSQIQLASPVVRFNLVRFSPVR